MVCDNLNTHDKSSFYEAFPPDEALRHAKRFEFHHTPKHGSWLDIAEIELSALSKHCLGKRRIENTDDLNSELEKWHTDRNERQKGVNWQFPVLCDRIRMEEKRHHYVMGELQKDRMKIQERFDKLLNYNRGAL